VAALPHRIPGLLLAGTHSGCGKTTVTLGVMAALARRGLAVQPFKAGPDFIDPTLHRLVTGRLSHNLDAWMCGEDFVRACFARHAAAADIAVVEGVMGFFDGGEGSAAHLAKLLGLPVILVVDARSMAESAAALVKGFETLDPAVRLAGVILNRVGSERHLELLRTAIGLHCRAEVVGHLPREASFAIPERHLGLHMGEEAPLGSEAIGHLAETVASHIDLGRLLALAATAEPQPVPASREEPPAAPVRIGIARDKAFCFYYEENLALLAAAGAELVAFSPLSDLALPPGLAGIYLGGGYPELHAAALAANDSMREAIRNWSAAGRPLYAECGGFMYLSQGIHDRDGCFHPMAGVYPVEARMQKGRASLGYREATLQRESLWGAAGAVVRGHEFHYSVIDPMPEHVARCYGLADGREEGYLMNGKTLGGYLHLHWGAHPEAAQNFVRICKEH
jgi:cobyrinic acid a,c-diamide synthase